MHKQGEQQAEGEGEADSPLRKDWMQGSIPRPWEHDLTQRQTLNRLSYPGAPFWNLLIIAFVG